MASKTWRVVPAVAYTLLRTKKTMVRVSLMLTVVPSLLMKLKAV